MTPGPGDKVICIDDSPCLCGCGEPVPLVKGAIYVVERVIVNHPSRAEPLLVLVGIRWGSGHSWFAPSSTRFRSLDEMKALLAKVNRHGQTSASDPAPGLPTATPPSPARSGG